MIPDLPKSVSDMDRLKFYDTLLGNLEEQSMLHEKWHTHRANPAVCWICDLMSISRKVLYLTEQYITKSPLDLETELSSEGDSDSEIELESLNKDEETYNEPEYDLSDDQVDTEL